MASCRSRSSNSACDSYLCLIFLDMKNAVESVDPHSDQCGMPRHFDDIAAIEMQRPMKNAHHSVHRVRIRKSSPAAATVVVIVVFNLYEYFLLLSLRKSGGPYAQCTEPSLSQRERESEIDLNPERSLNSCIAQCTESSNC